MQRDRHTHTHTHSQRTLCGGFSSCFLWAMRARERDGQKSLGKRGCGHKSVYWAVPETCRRTLGSRYQISNPISQMPSLLRHHMHLPDAVWTVTYMQRSDCLRSDVSSNSGTKRGVQNWADAHMRLTLFPHTGSPPTLSPSVRIIGTDSFLPRQTHFYLKVFHKKNERVWHVAYVIMVIPSS